MRKRFSVSTENDNKYVHRFHFMQWDALNHYDFHVFALFDDFNFIGYADWFTATPKKGSPLTHIPEIVKKPIHLILPIKLYLISSLKYSNDFSVEKNKGENNVEFLKSIYSMLMAYNAYCVIFMVILAIVSLYGITPIFSM